MTLPLTKVRSLVINLHSDDDIRGEKVFGVGPIIVTQEKGGDMSVGVHDMSKEEKEYLIESRKRIIEADGMLHVASWIVTTRGKER